jgi:hypothetical protein
MDVLAEKDRNTLANVTYRQHEAGGTLLNEELLSTLSKEAGSDVHRYPPAPITQLGSRNQQGRRLALFNLTLERSLCVSYPPLKRNLLVRSLSLALKRPDGDGDSQSGDADRQEIRESYLLPVELPFVHSA